MCWPLGQELVLVLMEERRHDEAEGRLKQFEKDFLNLGEEFLCRWGRLFKDRGDAHADLPGMMGDGRPPDPDLAAKYYRMSLEKYDEAYQVRMGHYPGINKATLLLILALARPPRGGRAATIVRPRREAPQGPRELAARLPRRRDDLASRHGRGGPPPAPGMGQGGGPIPRGPPAQ